MCKKYFYCTILSIIILSSKLYPVTFNLKDNINVSADYVYLYDIVSITDTTTKIENIKLFETPNIKTTYKTIDIYPHLTSAVNDGDYIVIGQSITINPNTYNNLNNNIVSTITQNQESSTLTKAILNALPKIESDDEYYKIKYLYKIPNVNIDGNDTTVSAIIKNKDEKDIKNIRFNIKNENNKTIDWFETVVEVHKMKDVYKANEYMVKGTAISTEQFEKTPMRSDRLPNDVITNIESLGNKTTEYHVKSGTILRMFHIKTDMIIKKGDMVKAHLQRDGVKIEIDTIAMENGYENKSIKLKNSQTGKVISGYVNKNSIQIIN